MQTYQFDPCGQFPRGPATWGRERNVTVYFESPQSDLLFFKGWLRSVWAAAGRPRRGVQIIFFHRCCIWGQSNEVSDVVERTLSFQTSIFSLSNSPGRPSYGSGSVSSRFRIGGAAALTLKILPLKVRSKVTARLSGHYVEGQWNYFEQFRGQICAFNTAGHSAIWRTPA